MHCAFNALLLIFLIHVIFKPISLEGCTHNSNHNLVIIKKLVADMFENIPDFFNVNTVGAAPEKKICPRDHQGIYNEPFCLILEDDKFLDVISSRIKDARNKEIHFKIEKKNAIVINQQHPLAKAIPAFNQNEKIITLLFPWGGYSIGTQFVARYQWPAGDEYSVLIPNFKANRIAHDWIPSAMTTESLQNTDPKLRFLECVKAIVKTTIRFAGYTIPYVWGGTSFIPNHNNHPFYLNLDDRNWHLDRVDKTLPYSGFDCSGLIWRILNMLDQIDHPWRNSSEMAKKLKKVNLYSQLENGDLLWFPGHIVIVANKKKGTIIEARGYSSGHGQVQKIKLNQLFENINDFQTLFRHKTNKINIYPYSPQPNIYKKPIATWTFLSITGHNILSAK